MSFLCVLVSQTFIAALLWLSFEKHFTTIALEPYRVIARSLSEDVKNNLDMGKTLTRFQAFPTLAANAILEEPYVSAAVLVLQDGAIAQWYSPGGELPEDLPDFRALPTDPTDASMQIQTKNHVHLLAPLAGSDIFRQLGLEESANDVSGYLDLIVSQELYSGVLAQLFQNFALTALAVSSVILLAAWILLALAPIRDRESHFRRRLILVLFLLPLLAGQTVLSFLFHDASREVATTQMSRVVARHASMFAAKLEYVLTLGITLHDISDLDAMLRDMVDSAPSIKAMAVFDESGRLLACGGQCPQTAFEHRRELRSADGGSQATILFSANMTLLEEDLISNLLDTLTIFVVSLLLMSELTLMGLVFFSRDERKKGAPVPLGILRGLAFLYFLALDFSISFIPLCMKELAGSAVKPSAVVLALPVSMEMATAGIAVFVAGVWAAKRTAAPPLLTGIALAALGSLCSGLAVSPATYVLARSLTGFGYGLGIMSLQNMAVSAADQSMRGANIAVLFAGVYAGNVCGSSLGGMLADRVGFAPVFMLGAAMLAILLCIVAVVFHLWQPDAEDRTKKFDAPPRLSLQAITHFFANRDVGGLMLLLVLPASLINAGMLNFLIPITLDEAGVKQSDIGRIFTVFSLVFIFLAPPISSRIARVRSLKLPLAFGGCLGGASLFFFALPGSWLPAFWSAFGAVLCASLATAISMSSQISFMLESNAAAMVGNEQAMSLYNTVERVSQVSGPLVFGSAMILLGPVYFSLGAGLAVIACALSFLTLARSTRHGHSAA
ncbi:MFS transporter [Desulfovibrio sp. OttesenSCG-928-M16]|nr:MFS transporter [Desulfovibrio sp. OttesenSCG-928-M16]